MKRTLALAAFTLAATLAPAALASADHLCVYSNGQPVACAPHLEEWIVVHEICVTLTSAGRPLVCVP